VEVLPLSGRYYKGGDFGGFTTPVVTTVPHPNPKLEVQHLLAVHECLFNIFAATHHTGGRSSIRKMRTRHAIVTWSHLSWPICKICKICKIFKWQEHTFGVLEHAVLDNGVTIVVNCYDVDWHMHIICKSDIIKCNCLLEFVRI
jgi:hypothetical protein